MNFKKILNKESQKLKLYKNDVSLVSIDNSKAVRKIYKDIDSMNVEISNIKMLSSGNVPVPNVLRIKENVAYIQMVEGITYVDIIDRIEQDTLSDSNIEKVAKELCEWLESFYKATEGCVRGDIDLNNFIFTTLGKCVSIDFEKEFEKDKIEVDMGKILAYIATYNPSFTQGKLLLCKFLYQRFLQMGADSAEVHNQYLKQVIAFVETKKGFAKIKDNAIKYFNLIKIKPYGKDDKCEIFKKQ